MPIRVVRPGERALEPVSQQGVPNLPESVGAVALRQIVSSDAPYVHIAQLPPGATVPVHSHSEDEVTVILSGTGAVGGDELETGSVVLVPANEEYDLSVVGDEPLTFLVVRPRAAAYRGGPG